MLMAGAGVLDTANRTPFMWITRIPQLHYEL